jgi:hypothetical protein
VRGLQLWFHGIVLLATFLMQRVGIKDEKKAVFTISKGSNQSTKVNRRLPMSRIDDQKIHKLEITTQNAVL